MDDFLSPWREEVEDVMMSGAAVMGVPGGIHMLWVEEGVSRRKKTGQFPRLNLTGPPPVDL